MVRSLKTSDGQLKATVLRMKNIGALTGSLEDQNDKTIVDAGMFGKLRGGVWRGDVSVFWILSDDRDGDILIFQNIVLNGWHLHRKV